MDKRILTKEKISGLVNAVIDKGGVFVAPSIEARQAVYKPITNVEEITFDYIVPRNSFKEFLFPQTETIARYTMGKEGVELAGVETGPKKTVIFGARPCDANSSASLRSVFTWDYVDTAYTKREDDSVVMTIACTKGDDACFCTTIGLSPETKDGSDIFLRETDRGDFIVEARTEKGTAFVNEFRDYFEDNTEARAKGLFQPQKLEGVDLGKISGFLKDKKHYDSPVWRELSSKCIGCGACTYACPTCHCFDIMDEANYREGERKKNWDSCQFDFFTLHASGHNPRDAQYKRWRNRFMCKFNFYPEKFYTKGCVGCGRCIRVCPVRLDITEVMVGLSKL